jgi:2-oxo-4-hydroxy-4-carboxy-5-ureidoimidazoline decarboxylase
MTLNDLNAIPPARATELFTACCGSSRWVSQMVARRPFASLGAVLAMADEVWKSLAAVDWFEAFAHHPRIGEATSAVAQSDRGREWSAGEQASVTRASESIRLAQRDMNAQYERRFGYIYIVCATGKTPSEMFAIARGRLSNDPATELKVAAEEQRKIMRLRLEKLLEARS